MRVRLTALAAIAAALTALLVADAARAHVLKPRCTAKLTAARLHECQHRALHHYATAVRWLRARRSLVGSGRELRWHRAAARWTRRELAQTHRRLYRSSSTTAGPAWLVRAFLCIHRWEGPWNANTGNGYYGGLQMDWTFMRTYGPELLAAKGTANNWTPAEQLAVAIRAYNRGRGFYPWPTAARRCGLI